MPHPIINYQAPAIAQLRLAMGLGEGASWLGESGLTVRHRCLSQHARHRRDEVEELQQGSLPLSDAVQSAPHPWSEWASSE